MNFDVFLIGGQSNAEANGTLSSVTSWNPPVGGVYKWDGSAVVHGADPVTNGTGLGTGSMWPRFGLTYYQATGRKILFVSAAVGGTSLAPEADQGSGYWGSGSASKTPIAIAKLHSVLYYLTANGHTYSLKGMLWCQGEADAIAINASTSSAYNMQVANGWMKAQFRAAFGSEFPIYIFRTGAYTPNDAGFAAIRAAQGQMIGEDYYSRIVFRDAVNFPSVGWMNGDNIHWSQTGLNWAGHSAAVNVVTGGANPDWSTRFGQ